MGTRGRLVAVYDLSVSPASFDFFSFVSMAQVRLREGGYSGLRLLVLPGPESGFREGDSQGHNWPEWRYRHILGEVAFAVAPDADLIFLKERNAASVFLEDAGFVFPDGYRLEKPIGYYDISAHLEVIRSVVNAENLWVSCSSEARRIARSYFESVCGGRRPILITLRDCPYYDDRNSQIDEWLGFARHLDAELYFPIFIPDSDGGLVRDARFEGMEVCSAASYNFELRLGLYAEAYLNLVVNNGPVLGCLRLRECRYLHFKPMVPGNKSSGIHAYRSAGMLPGDHWPRCTELQRYVWAADDESTITAAFQHMVALIENAPLATDEIMAKLRERLDAKDGSGAFSLSAVAISFFSENSEAWLLRLKSLMLVGRAEELIETLRRQECFVINWEANQSTLVRLLVTMLKGGEYELYQEYGTMLQGEFSRRMLRDSLDDRFKDVMLPEFRQGGSSREEGVLVFGTGESALRFMEKQGRSIRTLAFVDNDASKWGSSFEGILIVEPSSIVDYWPCRIVLASMYAEEIKEQLVVMGVPLESMTIAQG